MNDQSELAKTYNPKKTENKWYPHWEKEGYFKPRQGKTGKSYCIIMPPPNVTGKLHMGHALDATTQDALTRFKRMKGFETLWLPGMDHAGIATQAVVENMIWEKEKKSRHDYGRDKFLEKVWSWKEEYGGLINQQQRSLGASCDWDYLVFTMDKGPNLAVREFFVTLYNEGLIYQSDYIINWDPVLHSAISDAEVEHKEVKGAFYHLHYKVKETGDKLEIATTRPETLLGDTAVAVNPNDDRFKHLIGKTAIVPLCEREVPIIGDEHVDIELGTGCLKVTPGHDFNDFEIGQRHKLEVIKILNKDGTLNDYGLEWKGMSGLKARKGIVEKLDELGILVGTKEHVHQVGHGDRSKAVIEPMVSKQWFMDVQKMAQQAVQAVEKEDMKFFPKGWENTYYAWLREPKNWCISRQLWWGHRIPVFTCNECHHEWADKADEPACPNCTSSKVTQDPDVLDTWFSSGLWPFSTLGWPDTKVMQQKQFHKFFPGDVLVTGFDIIFFWVARMMMMSLKVFNKVPFDHTYIHAIVRDKLGRKMSKSLGNGIDPLDMVEQYGADAMRFCLAAGSGYNRNINLDPARIEGYRNFVNKVWNAFRFVHPFIDNAKKELPAIEQLTHQDRWILAELNTITELMNKSIEEYRFDDACSAIYSFVYDKFCSWYIEMSKPILYGDDQRAIEVRVSVLRYTFREIVALLHPITPYITEELWSILKNKDEDLLIIQDYPEYKKEFNFEKDRIEINRLLETITIIRNLRQSVNVKPKDEVEIQIFSDDKDLEKYFNQHFEQLESLARLKELHFFTKSDARPEQSTMGATSYCEIFLPLAGLIDIEAHKAKIQKDIEKTKKELSKHAGKLKNQNFTNRAPAEVIHEVKEKAEQAQTKLESLEANLAQFQA